MKEPAKKTLRLTPEAEKALQKLQKHFGENTENKAINKALVEAVKLIDLLDKTEKSLNSVSEDYTALRDALNRKRDAESQIQLMLQNPTKKQNFKR